MRRIVALLIAALAASSMSVVSAPAVGAGLATTDDEPKVVVFFDPLYVDTGEEAQNLVDTLEDLGIDPVLVDELASADFAAILAGVDDFLIPELEESNPLDPMTDQQLDDIRAFIADGGRVGFFGSTNPFPLMNALIDTSFEFYNGPLSQCNADYEQGEPFTCFATATKASSEFANGPASLGYNDDTYGAPLDVEANTKVIYLDEHTGGATVFVQPFGHGSVVFFAWDWFFDTDPTEGPIDEGWFEVLALSLGIGVAPNDVTVTEGQTATFTISLDGVATQDVVVDYETVDGTAKAGTDYTAESGTAIVPAGSSSVTVDVPTVARPGDQGARQFALEISTPAWGITVDSQGAGTIDDTPTPTTEPERERVTPRFTG